MSPKQWLALFCFYITYLLFGASIFYHIERDLEARNFGMELQRRIDVNGNKIMKFGIEIRAIMQRSYKIQLQKKFH